MTKKEIQEYLSQYKDNEELFVMLWDKEFIDYIDDNPVTDKEWNEVVSRLDGYEFEDINESINYTMEEELANIKE